MSERFNAESVVCECPRFPPHHTHTCPSMYRPPLAWFKVLAEVEAEHIDSPGGET